MNITKARRQFIESLGAQWDDTVDIKYTYEKDAKRFVAWLGRLGWNEGRRGDSGGNKYALFHKNFPFVIKFDLYQPEHGIQSLHAWGEWHRWHSAPPELKKHLAEIICWHRGLIVQEKVIDAGCAYDECEEAHALARKWRISHEWHHSHNPLKFYDYDSWGFRYR